MSQPYLKLTADDLVHQCTTRLGAVKGEFAFRERETIIAFAIDLAMQYRASTDVHDELIGLALTQIPTSGSDCALRLAPHASKSTQEKLLAVILDPLQYRDVNRVTDYADKVLHRLLTLQELRKMKNWFHSCSNDSEKTNRQRLLNYIEVSHPLHLKEFEEYFKNEQTFWEDGPGSML